MTKPWKIVTIALVALLVLNAIGIYLWQKNIVHPPAQIHEHPASEKTLYHCPMHPSIVSETPGVCPICKMELARVDDEPSTPAKPADRKILFYRHPMQPEVTSKVPAKDEMGMDYIPVYEEQDSYEKSSVDGRAAFSLSPESQQKIGVTSIKAIVRSLAKEIRATGRVAYDPELYAAIEEYRQALVTRQQLKNSSYQGFVDQSAALVKSSETRLRLLGLPEDQIGKIAQGRTNAMNLILPEGKVWVYAEVFEYEVTGLRPGQNIEADAPSIPGETFKGRISSISPVLNAPTRTVRVRAEVPDPRGLLRPDTYLNVRIESDLGQKLTVPEDSVLFSNSRAYVFVKDDTDRFHPRAVELGAKAQGYYQITAGLNPDEVVVTGANFLIDSESRLKAVLMQNETGTHESGGRP